MTFSSFYLSLFLFLVSPPGSATINSYLAASEEYLRATLG